MKDSVLIVLHETDNVAVMKRTVKAGEELRNGSSPLRAATNIGAGHKIALTELPDGAPVRKYGQIIGFARGHIAPGDHVHLHNLAMKDFGRDYQFCADVRPVRFYPSEKMRHFQGYGRPGGRAGTRNYVAVISSVNCSASVSHYVRDRFRDENFRRDFPNVDGVVAFTHKAGCAMDPGEPQQVLQRVLGDSPRASARSSPSR